MNTELVRTIIFQQILDVTFFKGIFWNFEFGKNYMKSNMLFFHCDVISGELL